MVEICVATTTKYETAGDFRLRLTLNMLSALRKEGIKAVVVDGSGEDVKEMLEGSGTVILPDKPGSTMGQGRRRALRHAESICKDGIVVWMEPEKYPLVPFIRHICAPIAVGLADIVIPRRADKLLSYPVIQRFSELLGNEIFKQLTDLDLDTWFGPRAMNYAGLSQFLAYEGVADKYGDKWQSIFIPLLMAIMDGRRLEEVVIDYVHPYEQTVGESNDLDIGFTKRMTQLREVGESLVTYALATNFTQRI